MFEDFDRISSIVNNAKDSLNEEDIDYSYLQKELDANNSIEYKGEHSHTNIPDLNDYKDEYEKIELEEYDTPIFVGGPTVTQLKLWKKQFAGYDIYLTEILDVKFVFRTLNRFEYKSIIAHENIDAMQREEIICHTATLFPQDFEWGDMAKLKAGIPSSYSDIILEKSGFTKDYAIRML